MNGWILVVDDEKPILQMMPLIFKDEGYRIITAPSGLTAIDVIWKTPEIPRIVITDLDMPQIDGVQVIQQVRERYKQEIPAIIISGGFLKRSHEECLKTTRHLLQKPFGMLEIRDLVRVILHPT